MLRAGTIAGALLVSFVFLGTAQDTLPKGIPAAGIKTPEAIVHAAAIRQMLSETVEIPEEFRRGDVAFPDFLKFFTDRLAFRGQELPIFIDRHAFHLAEPDAPDVMDTMVRFPPYIRQMPIRDALQIAVNAIQGNRAAIVVRNGRIDFVPEQLEKVRYLLDQRVVLRVKEMPLKMAVDEISATTGLTVFLDPRCQADIKQTVSVEANNDISVRGVLSSWADIHDLKLIVDEHRVMLMPRADYLRKLRDDAEEATLQATILKSRGIDPKSVKTPAPMGK